MDKDTIIDVLLDNLARAVGVISSQPRLQRDEATLRRIAGEISRARAACVAARAAAAVLGGSDSDASHLEAASATGDEPVIPAPKTAALNLHSWQAEAMRLRELAESPHLTDVQVEILMREAEAADRAPTRGACRQNRDRGSLGPSAP